jgi:fumarate hydratase class I
MITKKKSSIRKPAARPTKKAGGARPKKPAAKPAPSSKARKTPPASSGPSGKVLRGSLLEIVRKTSAELSEDVIRAVAAGRAVEPEGSNALWAMKVIEENIDLAKEKSLPLCQDTGTILFFVKAPRGFDQALFARAASAAVAEATAKGYLRQNSVDSLTGRNSGNNLGPGSPVFHFTQWNKPGLDVRLVLKGGGCENVGAQYSLPHAGTGAGRDLRGVEKVLLDAVHQAQGKGCGPGILGVCIGGDRATGYAHSKEQFLRPLDDTNPHPDLAGLEKRVVEKANELGIGPMGFGGRTTLLGCKVGALNRLPASFFVSISYMCWAYRRQGAQLAPDGTIRRWLY